MEKNKNSYQEIRLKFTEYLKLNNKAKKTIYDRLWYLKHFFIFLKAIGLETPVEINSIHLKEYRKYLHEYINQRGHKDKPRTINSRTQAVRLFLKFLYQEDYIPQDLINEMPYIKEPKSLPSVVLTNQEIKKILKQCNTNTVIGYRDRTILEVFYSSGLRRNELINLKKDDVNVESGYIRVNHGKGDKDRVVPLGKIACHYVENYLIGVRKLQLRTGKDPEWLFLSKTGRKFEITAIRDIILSTVKRSGIEKHITSHTFRRSCATEMIKNNANLMHVKEILGHEDISSTQRYTKLTIVDLKEAHKKYHPREKDSR